MGLVHVQGVFVSTLLTLAKAVQAQVECTQTADCERILMKGSVCRQGICSNPFYEQGCLAAIHKARGSPPDGDKFRPNFQRTRRCTSVDPFDAEQQGFCQMGRENLDYQEIRIYSQNWESVFFEAWILQIILTEVLGVPVTLETGVPNVKLDFHDKNWSFGYGSGNDYTGLVNAVEFGGDCSMANQQSSYAKDGSTLPKDYEPCFHFVPEVWTTQMNRLNELKDDGFIEQPEGLGVVGQMNWWIPKFTALRDPTLLTYFGLAGEEHRRKLADVFKRPTTWGDYCNQVSTTKCQEPDSVATRAPATDDEAGQYFNAQYYTGHFRKTAENDCDTNELCTGHIADFPCGWSSFVEQQTWHLGIALRSSGHEPGCRGYKYEELLGIFAAANATKSDVIFQWWTPDAVHNTYAGTDSEFQAVGMPLPTLDCIQNTVTSVERCDEDPDVRRGSAEGACGEPPYPLQKVYSSVLFDITRGGTREAEANPAYDLFKSFSLTSLQLGDLYDRWLARGSRVSFGFDLRYATCEWMLDNWDLMESFIPRGFPRTTKRLSHAKNDPLFVASIVLASVAGTAILFTSIGTYLRRDRAAIKNAQLGFLCILLLGLSLLEAGSIISILPPSNVTCSLTPWLVNLGYTMELIPLIVKVAAIQKLMHAARQMRRVNLNMRDLYVMVVGVCGVLIVYLGLWTILDAPSKAYYSTLTDDVTKEGEILIQMTPFCESESDVWRYLSAVWHSLLLIAATLLAFQTRKLKTDFGETETLGILVYSHFVFVALRVLTYTVNEQDEADARLFRSLIYSCNILSSVGIYFVPKFLHKENERGIFDLRTSASIPASLRADFSKQASNAGLQNTGARFNNSFSNSFGSERFKLAIPSIAEVPGEDLAAHEDSSLRHAEEAEDPSSMTEDLTPASKHSDSSDSRRLLEQVGPRLEE